jgi:hypothetical protein
VNKGITDVALLRHLCVCVVLQVGYVRCTWLWWLNVVVRCGTYTWKMW